MDNRRARDLERVLGELLALERELVEHRYVRRSDGTERVREALRRLGEVGSPAGILSRSAEELGTSSDFDIVLVSRIEDEQIRPQVLWCREGNAHADEALATLQDRAIPLRYPLIEAEVAQRHQAVIVSVDVSGARAASHLVEAFGWRSYAVADIIIEGRLAGFVHAGRNTSEPAVDDIDLQLVTVYAQGLAQLFERAMLRDQLRRQQLQLQSAARWINAQIHDLSAQAGPAPIEIVAGQVEGADLLTARELDVMRLIAQGLSNRAIATALMIGEGTVKYHVKNLLGKLQARTRTEAISRYVRLYAGSEE